MTMENAAVSRDAADDSVKFGTWVLDQRHSLPAGGSSAVSVELGLASGAPREQVTRPVYGRMSNSESSGWKRLRHQDGVSAFAHPPSERSSVQATNLPNYDTSFPFDFMSTGSANDGDLFERDGGYDYFRTMDSEKSASENHGTLEDAELLTLKLGGNGCSHGEEERDLSPNSKRCEVFFPPGQHPRCQVDGCLADLIHAKDYHRRHKVCEVHAKALKASVAKAMQRFCQQCSRFHQLEEFDENKRSCRRRLAGHNKRRRKTHPDATVSHSPDGDPVMNLIRLLTNLQGCDFAGLNRILSGTDELIQCLGKANFSPGNLSNRAMHIGNMESTTHNQDTEPSSTLAGATEVCLQRPEGAQVASLQHIADYLPHTTSELTDLDRYARQGNLGQSQSTLQSAVRQLKPPGPEPALTSKEVLLGSDLGLSNIGQNTLLQSGACNQNRKHKNVSNDRRIEMPARHERSVLSDSDGCQVRRNSFGLSSYCGPFGLRKLPSEVVNENSELVSEQLQRNIYPDSMEWTDRIVFKLFDRKPGEMPLSLQKQILDWLAHSPSNMESYIRPGCVIVTVFLSMQASAWERLSTEIEGSLVRLIKSTNCELWQRGRILVQIGQEIGFIVEGRVYVNSLFKAVHIPRIISVKPFAVVMGEKIELLVKGHNLKVSGARIICSYRGDYTYKELFLPEEKLRERESCVGSSQGFSLDEAYVEEEHTLSFKVGPFDGPGRCFIEVEQSGLGGKVFPIIIADSALCEEILALERELEDTCTTEGTMLGDGSNNLEANQSRLRANGTHFLHELGWLLESQWQLRHLATNMHFSGKFSPSRFRWLLNYAVEHNCCSVTLKVLDCLFSIGVESEEEIYTKAVETLSSEISLLHRAVKINSRHMVELLLEYSPPYFAGKSNIFTPDVPGPGGLTPLHIAASMQDAIGLIDALTEGPIQVWMSAWISARDKTGHTPLSYALASGNHTYIQFVQQKITRLKVSDEETVKDAKPGYRPAHADIESNITPIVATGATIVDGNFKKNPLGMNQSPHVHKLAKSKIPSSGCACRDPFSVESFHRIGGVRTSMCRPFILSLLAIAAVCVCVCILLKGPPEVLYVQSPFTWESVNFGYI